MLSLGWIFNYVHRMAIPPLIPIIKNELGITNAQAGYFGDKIGRKRLVVISILDYSLASPLMVFAKQYWHLISVRALYGVFAGLYYPPFTALISEVYKEKKGSALGVFMIGPLVGSAITPAIVVSIALALEWRYSFVIISLVSALIGIALIHEVKGKVREVEGVNFAIPKMCLD